MTSALEVLLEAKTWINTPYVHQARLKGVGVDCLGVIIGVGKNLALTQYDDCNDYGMIPLGNKMKKMLEDHPDLISIEPSKKQIGDIGLFTFSRFPQHLGIISDVGVIHSSQEMKRCLETQLSANSDMRLIAIYRFAKVAIWQA